VLRLLILPKLDIEVNVKKIFKQVPLVEGAFGTTAGIEMKKVAKICIITFRPTFSNVLAANIMTKNCQLFKAKTIAAFMLYPPVEQSSFSPVYRLYKLRRRTLAYADSTIIH
jgi:hypothetical protein